MKTDGSLLTAAGICKVFGGTVALEDANLEVTRGEIHALLGENGAGKSTFIKILAGIHAADGGHIELDGAPLHAQTGHDQRDIAFIHQDLGLVGELSVAENIALATGYSCRAGLISWRTVRRQVADALRTLGVDIEPDTLVSELPIGEQATVAIARALALNAKLLVLDEATASLAAGEVDALFGILRRLRERGISSLFVSHRLDEVLALCDRVTVFRNGRSVGCARIADVSHGDLVRMIVGHDVVPGEHRTRTATSGRVVLQVNRLRGPLLGPLSFDVREGDIIGFTGLSDAGGDELLELLLGRAERVSGECLLDGRAYTPRNPADAWSRGIAVVPADRNAAGLGAALTLRENLFLNPGRTPGWSPRPAAEREVTLRILERYDVRPPEPERETSTLSGGNAQKLLLARSLCADPRILVLHEPTTGVDVGAREQIYDVLRAVVDDGAACIVISSDFAEVAQLCDRAHILWRGNEARVLSGPDLTTQQITAAAVGWREAA